MSKTIWNLVKVAPAVLGASLFIASSAQALPNSEANSAQTNNNTLEQIQRYNNEVRTGNDDAMGQVTNVNQLRDVAPTDWAYEALRSLVERYGCIAGYPNQTFRGNQAMTRYEFAAGLNACLNQIERLIASSEAVLREDIDKLTRLTEEFQAELAALGARVDNLEGRTAFLEDHQFSTTTKLRGEVIFALTGLTGEAPINGIDGVDDNGDSTTGEQFTLSDRVRLNFETSFTGKDLLRTRLQAANVPNLGDATQSDMARLAFDNNNGNDIELDDLYYRFPVGENITAMVGTNGLDLDDVFNPTNPYFESSGSGALSRFARYNPLVFRGPEGAGGSVKYGFNDQFNVIATYLAEDTTAGNPEDGDGLFNGSFSTGVQLGYSPNEDIDLTFAYVHKYQDKEEVNLTSSTGSADANDPFGLAAATSENFGLQGSWKISDRFNLAGWVGYGLANEEGGNDANGDADLYTGALNLAVLDVGKEGSVIGLTVGIPPYRDGADDEDVPVLVEGQYQYPITENITVTPGVYAVFNPNSNSDNDTIVVGTVRTTFKF